MPRTAWPPYRTLRDLIHRHVGVPAVVMGGGPSLQQAIPKAPANAIFISVNDHGVRYFKHVAPQDSRRCSYVVCCDKIEQRARFDARENGDGSPWHLPVISRHMWADYRLLFQPAPSSGMAAAYFARLLGCSPIIITGMDLYAGGTYHDNPKALSSGKSIKPGDHRIRWFKLAAQFPAMYRAIGCDDALRDRVGEYDPNESPRPPTSVEFLVAELRRERCEITRQAIVCMREFPPGQVLDLMKREVDHLVKERKGRRLAIVD